MEIQISYPLAFLAGLVSFLSPCVLPVVPSYVAFVSGMTLEELQETGPERAQRTAVVHAIFFALGFIAVFMTLGLGATAFGQAFNRSLPLVSRLGGVIVTLFGLYLTGVVRIPLLAREFRAHLASKPAGVLGSFFVGLAFGAGWTPCIGPILGTILFYASLENSAFAGMTLLLAYGVGLALPFVGAAAGFNWFLARMNVIKRWSRPLEVVAGILLVVIGISMITGQFASLSAVLAGMGQWINLEL